MQPSFLDVEDRAESFWTPPPLEPIPSGVTHVGFDVETTGLRWWDGDRPIGFSVSYGEPGQRVSRYYPFGHRGGGNLDENQCKEWAKRELTDRNLYGLNIKFDIHQFREWGIDIERQRNRVSDVGHTAALLDDFRKRFSLDVLARDFLGKSKVGKELDTRRMQDYHAGDVAPRAESDASLVLDLREAMYPEIVAQDLGTVQKLEDDVLFPICEMEKNGSPIDVELLERWLAETEQTILRAQWKMWDEVGIKNFNPKSSKDKIRLFEKLHLPITELSTGNPTFTDAILEAIEHPLIQLLRQILKLESLRSKYLLKYKNGLSNGNILRYALHQLRAVTSGDETVGTITGRFSSTAVIKKGRGGDRDEGANIQQSPKPSKQDLLTQDYLIRCLHLPGPDALSWLSADARQIEYRLFGSYSRSKRIIDRYREDPLANFHKFIFNVLTDGGSDIDYSSTKNLNFAKIYGAGLGKLALMIGYITDEELAKFRGGLLDSSYPPIARAKKTLSIYDKELPEVGPLFKRATRTAETRGYVRTLLGRRGRFKDGKFSYKALNKVLQGGAADIMKQKIIELHREREYTGYKMRFTVHDETDGDAMLPETAARVQEVLDAQSFKLSIPILWEVSTGENWGVC